jgi:hypothetical protein
MQLGNFHVAWNAPLPCTRLPGNGATFGVILGWYIGSYRTSMSVGERRGFEEMRTLMQRDPGRAYLPGLVAELARGYYWDLVHDLATDASGAAGFALR